MHKSDPIGDKGGGSQKFRKFCGHHIWKLPNSLASKPSFTKCVGPCSFRLDYFIAAGSSLLHLHSTFAMLPAERQKRFASLVHLPLSSPPLMVLATGSPLPIPAALCAYMCACSRYHTEQRKPHIVDLTNEATQRTW